MSVSWEATKCLPAMLQVTKDNFTAVLPIVEQALKHCQFYAFDCEMTGLKHTYNDSISYFADMQERYAQVRRAHTHAMTSHSNACRRVAQSFSHCLNILLHAQLQTCCSPMHMHVVLNAGCSQRQGLPALPVWTVSLLLAGRQIRGPDVQLPLVPQVTCRWCSKHNEHHLTWTLLCHASSRTLLVCPGVSSPQHICPLVSDEPVAAHYCSL